MTKEEKHCVEDACQLCEQTRDKLQQALDALLDAETVIRERIGWLDATAVVNRKRHGLDPERKDGDK